MVIGKLQRNNGFCIKNLVESEKAYFRSRLRPLPAETELVEFKKAENSFSDTDLGVYFSALSNEANLKGVERAWLVFGVDNNSHKGHYYGRDGESVVALNLHEIELIRSKANARADWSAEVIAGAGIDDLDSKAIAVAREYYANKHEYLREEMKGWTNMEFLNRAKITAYQDYSKGGMINIVEYDDRSVFYNMGNFIYSMV